WWPWRPAGSARAIWSTPGRTGCWPICPMCGRRWTPFCCRDPLPSRGMTIDAVEYHLGDSAATEHDAAWHIGVFLQWCARNGMLAPRHAAAEAIADPIKFLLLKCSGKLDR